MSRTTVVLAFSCALVASAPSFAGQEPQVADPERPVLVQPADPARPGLVKRKVSSLLSDDDEGGGRGFHFGPFVPRVDIVSSGSGPGPILHFWTPNIAGSAIDIHASAAYSINKYQYYDMQVGLVPHAGESLPRVERGTNALFPLSDIEKTASAPGFNIYLAARYRDYPEEDYFGLGSTSLQSALTGYRLRDELYEGVIRFRLSRLSLMGRAGVLSPSIRPGASSSVPTIQARFNDRTAPGLFNTPDFLHYSGGAWLEMRDQPHNARKGLAVGLAFSRFDDRNGESFQWNRVSLDAREYLPLGSRRHVLALRQVASFDDPDRGMLVPFYMQATIGGSHSLRGYDSFRFRDGKILSLQAEYRFELRPKVEIALLYEAGNVFPSTRRFAFDSLLRSYGAGIRLKSPRKVKVRFDVLRSVEGTRMHIKLGPSF